MLPGKDIFLLFIGSFLLHCTNAINAKHMYALCPPDFFGIGTECYYISQKKENWLDAHFDCKDRKSRLAEPNRYEDRMVRRFLVNNDLSKESKWIGGNYNWAQRKWQWQDGKEFTYQSFSQTPGGVQELQYHCAILNPNLKYRWSASSCVEKHQYICQHRMPYVNEKHRSRIFARWNQTYPNEEATQVEVVITEAEMLKRGHRQSVPVNGRSTNTQRLSRHRNYLANEWLKKYKSQQIVLNRNAFTNEISLVNTPRRKPAQRPNRLAPRRRNPSIGRDDFIQFERNNNVYRPLITNQVDDFDREVSNTVAPTISNRYYEETTTTHRNRAEDHIPPPVPPRMDEETTTHRYRTNDHLPPRKPSRRIPNELDLKERKRLEDTKRLLETGRFEHSYTRQRIATTTATATTTTEPNVDERTDAERDRDLDYRRQQEEEQQERLRDEEIRRNEQRRKAEERRREEEERHRMEERRQAEERQIEEERLQNQINEEMLRSEHEEELRRSRLQQEEQRRAEERKRIHDENLREREERIRMRELELKEREEEERKIREDEEKRQEENRKRLEEIERQQREEEDKKQQEAENKRIEEENKKRRNDELKQKMRQNRVDISSEEQALDDLRLKEKLRREKIAKMKERLSKLTPEEQLKFFELRKRNKKNSENETSTNH